MGRGILEATDTNLGVGRMLEDRLEGRGRGWTFSGPRAMQTLTEGRPEHRTAGEW